MAVEFTLCRDCGASILWARDESGQRIAMEPEPAADGRLRLLETERSKLLAFAERWRWTEQGGSYDFGSYVGMGKEWFGLYRRHSCPAREQLEKAG